LLTTRSGLLAAAAACALIAATTPAAAAPAPTPAPVAFNIEAGALEAALMSYAAQAHRQILVDPALVAGLRAPELKGSLSPDQALDRLLAGSGLVVRRTGPNVFVVRAGVVARADLRLAAAEAGSPALPAAQADGPIVPAAAAPQVLDEVVITGSLIRGDRPGASPVRRFDRDEIDRQGRATVGDLIAALPQNFGGIGSPAAAILGSDSRGTNDLAATGVNLRGLGAAATLVLVNGRRMGGVGTKGDFADVSAIPSAVVDRVDVLLDGASALYGSDAVGGVVNVILKRRFDGLETRLRAGAATRGGDAELQASQAGGTSWDGGGLVLAYEYGHRGGLKASEREVTASSDLRPLGGTDRRVFYSHPANILRFDAAQGAYVAGWAVPAGQDGKALKPSDLIPGLANLDNQRQGGDVLPREDRHNLYAALTQDLGERVRLLADLRYNRRDNTIHRPAPVAVFAVTSANPFFVSPNGTTSDVIGYSFSDEVGPSVSDGRAESLGLSLGAEADLGRGWRGEAYAATGLELGRRNTERLVNSTYLNEALGAVPDDPRTAYTAARDGYFNPFGDGGANGRAVLDFIGSGYTRGRTQSSVATFDAKADGPLWALPAGTIKAAVGVQARLERFKTTTSSLISGTTPTLAGGTSFDRTVQAAFLELRAPLVSPEMGLPLLRELEASLAGRIERYGDFGQTANPKLGLVWAPAEALKLRASYGTSFRAPNLSELNEPPSSSPLLLAGAGGRTLVLLATGGNAGLKPERARSWTFGLDYASVRWPGLTASATWFDVRFADQIGQPVLTDLTHALTNPAFAPFVRAVDPANPADLAQVKALMAISTNSNITLFPAEAYRVIADGRYVNTGEVEVRGLDLQAAYGWTRGDSRWSVSGDVSYLSDYVRRFTPTAAPLQLLDTANNPVRLRGRLAAGWDRGPWGVGIGLNYVDAYRSETGRRIEAWTPVDLQARWTPAEAGRPWSGLSLALNVQNLFDQDPPFYDSPLGIGYDPANADPLGRRVSLQLTRRW
jgi:iron complex outermembrane receptor protein